MRRVGRTRVRRLLPILAALALVAMLAGQATALPAGYPSTSRGDRGVNVKALQHLLRHHGAVFDLTTDFTSITMAAVRAFQKAHDVEPTGVVDSATWAALRVPLTTGAEGEAVIALQRLLNEKRQAKLEITRVYDEATRAAVLAFQRHAGLTRSGDATPGVWRALLAHLELPVWGKTLCDYSVGNGPANWGTASAIGQIQAAARIVVDKGHGRVAIGDIGYEHGGEIAGHVSHEYGMDVDVRPMRKAKDQCRWGVNIRWSTYDRPATRDLIKAIRATAPAHVKLIYFNDPVLIREGLVTAYPGHDDHLHVRYCAQAHPVAAYRC